MHEKLGKLNAAARFFLVTATLFLGACVPRPPIAFDSPQQASCCSTLRLATFQIMSPSGPTHAHISTNESPTFDFPDGRSTFVAYRLPASHAETVEVDTYLSSSWLPDATVFRPRLIFLDENYRTVGYNHLDKMEASGKFVGGTYYFGISEIPVNSRYLVVYGAPSAHTERLVSRSDDGHAFGIPNAYEGDISLIVK
jgi:hypothetical protein